MMILDYPKVYIKDKFVGHGGNQDWFLDSWARKAGCASVSATGIFLYYTKKDHRFDKDIYLDHMTEMFKLMEPQKKRFSICIFICT